MEDVCTPDLQTIDHRAVGMGTVVGSDLWPRWRAASAELMQDQTYRVEDVLVLGADGLLRRTTETGTVRASGGAFENSVWILSIFGPDGRQARIELFDIGREAEALARYDALVDGADRPPAPAPSAPPFANAVSRHLERCARTWAGRDWPSLTDLYAPDCRFDDRRRLLQMQLPREANLQQLRVLFEVPNGRWTFTPIATRGEHLMLARLFFAGEVAGGGGALEIDHLGVIEVDGSGRMSAVVLFEPADLDPAYAELDACYEAGEGAAYGRVVSSGTYARAYAERNWDAIAAMCTPTFAEHDHRAVAVLGTRHGPTAWAETERALVELAPDSVVRFNHVRSNARGALSQLTFYGADGGYEIPFLSVTALGAGGKLERNDLYDPEQLDEALARFAELAVPPQSTAPFANAATRAFDELFAGWKAREWQRFRALFAAGFRYYDRTPIAQLELDGEQWIAFTRQLRELRLLRGTGTALATRGERLALARSHLEMAEGDVGPSEIVAIFLYETNARGEVVAIVRFDGADLDAAYAELDARWRAGEAAAHPRVAGFQATFDRALASRDWDALAVLFAPTLDARDHRLVSWDVLRGPAAFLGALRAMVELAPDALARADHLRTSERGIIGEDVWVGTRDGGAFESPFLWVAELDAAGRAQRLDFYDPHHFDAARTRFDEIGRGTPDAPLAAIAKSNAAVATLERWRAAFDTAFDTDDWDAMRALYAPDMIWEDRRRMALLAGDRELFIASARERARTGARPEGWLVGTAGDRVAVSRVRFSGGPSGGRFEIEFLSVVEVDAAGLFTALLFFDLADARAAQREAWRRWAAIEPEVAPWVELVGAVVDAFHARDRERITARFADDIVVEDHRRTGFGRIVGADAYFETVAVLWDLAPDHHLELGWFWPAVEPHGVVTTLRRFGTLTDGGAFETDCLWLCIAAGGRITRAELFELEDLDKAVARLAELRPDPLRIPPNAATRWVDRWSACVAARDWEGLDRIYAPTAMFDDRRRLMRLTGDRATAIANVRVMMESGKVRLGRTLLATAGERVALERWEWRGGKPGADFAVDQLAVTEVDADGRFLACISFDPDDRAAASAELLERYAASGADGAEALALAAVRAWNAHDLERLRELLPADFYLDDRRRTGVGRLEGIDAYLTSLAAVWELSRDLRIETLYFIATEPHGRLYVCRWFGTNAEGGEFDAVYVCLGLAHGDRPVGLEIFELEDLEAARTRFEGLRRAP